MTRIFQRTFRLVTSSWHMYFVGFLFGLGFDTATEVGLLGISASAANRGLSLWSMMIFPVLFTAGMALVDSRITLSWSALTVGLSRIHYVSFIII